MAFNISKILEVLNTISNPKQAIDMMLSKLPPQQSNMLRGMMNSGKDPKQAILESAKSGQINIEQLNQAKQMYSMIRKFGYRKMSVPDSIWNEAEQLIKQGSNNSNNVIGGYTRF